MNLYIKLYVIQLSKTNKHALTRFLTDINSDPQLKQFDIKSYECRIIVEAPNKTNLADINSFNYIEGMNVQLYRLFCKHIENSKQFILNQSPHDYSYF
jgi:hypothetical protein